MLPHAIINFPTIQPAVDSLPRLADMAHVPSVSAIDICSEGCLEALERGVSMTHESLTKIVETIAQMHVRFHVSFGRA